MIQILENNLIRVQAKKNIDSFFEFYPIIIILMNLESEEERKSFEKFNKINYLSLESLESAMSDEITTTTYMNAIKKNPHVFNNKTVLHLTSGINCLYSIFAAQVGAQKVYCVINDNGGFEEKNIYMIKQIVEENQLSKIIEVTSISQFNAEVDVIIGEPMGYNFIFDGMMEFMINARDSFLKRGGIIFPDVLKYECAFIRDDHFLDKKVDFWDQVHGVQMKSMKKWISQEPVVRIVDPTLIVSDVTKFFQISLHSVTLNDIYNIKKSFTIGNHISTQANGLIIWFQIGFTKGEDGLIELKASPWEEGTRWTHTAFYFKNIIELVAGEKKEMIFSGKKNQMDGSAMIRLRIGGEEQIYSFS